MKRTFAALLAAALTLAFAGCGANPVVDDKEIAVTTLEEFLGAVGAGKTIRLDAEILLSELVDPEDYTPPKPANKALRWEDQFDGYELAIRGVNNLTIKCGPEGKLVTASRYSFVLSFEQCGGLTLEGLTAGHTQGGECSGGVLRLDGCKNVRLKDCDLYGCGTEGLMLNDVDGLTMEGGSIYECTNDIMTVESSENIAFSGCTFRDNREYYLVSFGGIKALRFEDCLFENNEGLTMFNECWGYETGEDALVNNCTFRGNRTEALSGTEKAVFEDCTYEGNNFDDAPNPAQPAPEVLVGTWRAPVKRGHAAFLEIHRDGTAGLYLGDDETDELYEIYYGTLSQADDTDRDGTGVDYLMDMNFRLGCYIYESDEPITGVPDAYRGAYTLRHAWEGDQQVLHLKTASGDNLYGKKTLKLLWVPETLDNGRMVDKGVG